MPRLQPTDLTIAIGMRIEKERLRRNMTREQLAEKIDVTTGFISDLERGRSNLSMARLIGICRVFSCSADFILFGEVSASTISARLNALPLPLREMVDRLVAEQIEIIEAAQAEKDSG